MMVISLLMTPESVAEISVCPGFTPVARPEAEIVATSVSVLLQVTSEVISLVVPSELLPQGSKLFGFTHRQIGDYGARHGNRR